MASVAVSAVVAPAVPAVPVDHLVIGVDTHRETHAAAALSGLGVVVDRFNFDTRGSGLAAARAWAASLGPVAVWGIEGTGSWGAGLARQLTAAGERVVEVNRGDRHTRRMLGGKSDPLDAEAAARAVLSGFATATPKSGDGPVEQIRIVRAARNSAVKARTATMNQLKALLVTAPPLLRDELAGLTPAALIGRCARLRPRGNDLDSCVKRTLRALAGRHRMLTTEITAHSAELTRLVGASAPRLLAQHGVGPDTAAALLITAGDNPQRLITEAGFAALCGTTPVPVSSGKTRRYRLNRGGNRQANAALHRIIIVRLATHPETRDYLHRHRAPNGANTMHVLRCLKRYLARRLYPIIIDALNPDQPQAAKPTP